MKIKYTSSVRLICALLLHHPSQRGKTFAQRETRQQVFELLLIHPQRDLSAKAADDGRVLVSLETPTPSEVVLSTAAIDALLTAIDALGAEIADEQSLYDLEVQLRRLQDISMKAESLAE